MVHDVPESPTWTFKLLVEQRPTVPQEMARPSASGLRGADRGPRPREEVPQAQEQMNTVTKAIYSRNNNDRISNKHTNMLMAGAGIFRPV